MAKEVAVLGDKKRGITMTEGFCVFVTPNFVDLCDVLLEGLNRYSTRIVELWGINCDLSSKASGRVIVRRVDSPHGDHSGLMMCRTWCLLGSQLDVGVLLDADCIPTPEVDKVFELGSLVEGYPLHVSHMDPINLERDWVKEGWTRMGMTVEMSMSYVHAACLFNRSCMHHFLEVLDTHRRWRSDRFWGSDELAHNVNLWKRGCSKQLGFFLVPVDVDGKSKVCSVVLRPYRFDSSMVLNWEFPGIFHGCKDVEQASRLLKEVESLK